MGKKTKSKASKARIEGSSSNAQVSVASQSTSKRPRSGDDTTAATAVKKVSADASGGGGTEGDGEDLVFEDPFGDEFEPEDIDGYGEDEGGSEKEGGEAGAKDVAGDGMEIVEKEEAERSQEKEVETKVWRAGVDELTEGEELEYDSTAYHMYHSLRPEWPCLSFDVIRDSLGTNRSRFPHTVFAVAGTQADRADSNRLQIMKLSDLQRTRKAGGGSDDDESDEEGPDETDDDPTLDHINIPHRGGVNRVRSMPQQPHIVATWSESSDVHVWDLEKQMNSLAKGTPRTSKIDPVFTYDGHTEEGFALDWSPTEEGRLATGDCGNCINVTQKVEGGWATDPVPFVGHVGSVEDLQWSPTESSVFASASADKTVAVWDLRKKNGAMLSVQAHEEDVNVISWNTNVTYLLASGSDDGSFKIWDLRAFGSGEPVAQFRWHKGPITSIEWHPTDESMLAASGADNQLTVWDLSVEADDEAAGPAGAAGGLQDLPPQLLFIHQGQTDIKELHFHPQIPGVIMSTAADGFNIFKPATTV